MCCIGIHAYHYFKKKVEQKTNTLGELSNKDTKKITLPTVEGKEEKALADDYGVPLMFYLSMRNMTYLLKCFVV